MYMYVCNLPLKISTMVSANRQGKARVIKNNTIHSYIHTYICAHAHIRNIHTYKHTHIHTYIHTDEWKVIE